MLGHDEAADTLGEQPLRRIGFKPAYGPAVSAKRCCSLRRFSQVARYSSQFSCHLFRTWRPSSRTMAPAAAPTRKAGDASKPGMWPYSAKTGRRIASATIVILETL